MDQVKKEPGAETLVAHISTFREAKQDLEFGWASLKDPPIGWTEDTLVGSVWVQTPDGGQTGLPGSIETTAEYARLFAAAPELLAACRRALHLLELHGSGTLARTPAGDDLRAAIAKATDGAP